VTFGLKHEAARALRSRRPLSPGEELLVRDEIPDLDDKGRVLLRPANLRLKSHVRFAFQIYSEAHGATSELDVGGEGWQAFQRAAGVRNRLMHPKDSAQLIVADDEMRDAMRAFIWFEHELVRLLLAVASALEAERGTLDAELQLVKARMANNLVDRSVK
jgi:hypothetical protein